VGSRASILVADYTAADSFPMRLLLSKQTHFHGFDECIGQHTSGLAPWSALSPSKRSMDDFEFIRFIFYS